MHHGLEIIRMSRIQPDYFPKIRVERGIAENSSLKLDLNCFGMNEEPIAQVSQSKLNESESRESVGSLKIQ